MDVYDIFSIEILNILFQNLNEKHVCRTNFDVH